MRWREPCNPEDFDVSPWYPPPFAENAKDEAPTVLVVPARSKACATRPRPSLLARYSRHGYLINLAIECAERKS